jgi:flagellar hook-associated protein 3 FlgL
MGDVMADTPTNGTAYEEKVERLARKLLHGGDGNAPAAEDMEAARRAARRMLEESEARTAQAGGASSTRFSSPSRRIARAKTRGCFVSRIAPWIASAQTIMKAANDRHQQAGSALAGMLEGVSGVPTEQVAAEILALQTRLQASMQVTALLSQTSLVNYLS